MREFYADDVTLTPIPPSADRVVRLQQLVHVRDNIPPTQAPHAGIAATNMGVNGDVQVGVAAIALCGDDSLKSGGADVISSQ